MTTESQNSNDSQRYVLALKLCKAGICDYSLPPEPSLHFSDAWASMLGYDVSEIPKPEIFQSWWGQQIHPNDHARVINTFNRLYSGEDYRLVCSFRILHKNKNWVDVEVSATALKRDKKGWAEHVFTVMRDITHGENRYQKIVENLHEGIWLIDRHNYTQYINLQMADILGYSIEEMMGKHFFYFMDEAGIEISKQKLENRRQGVSENYTFEFLHKSGHSIHATIAASPLIDAHYEYGGSILGVMDVTEQKKQDLKFKMLSSAVETSATMVMITNKDADIEYVNPGFCDITGYSKEEVIGKNSKILRSSDINSEQMADLWATVTAGKNWHGELHNKKKNGELFWSLMSISAIKDDHGQITHFVSVSDDISQLKEARIKMEELAYVDSLTGLANRLLFRDRLEQELKVIQRNKHEAALLFLDLDQFKRINDSLGHDVGDALLMQVADRLCQCVRHQDTVARMGGDEFVILLTDVDGMEGASSVARKILQIMNETMRLLTHEIIITASIGITLAQHDSLNADILLKNADMAMYRAKSSGRNNYQFFTEEMNSKVLKHLFIESELRNAIDKNQLLLEFQPQVSIDSGELLGAEVLVRWKHPEQGVIYPDDFIPVAEETGLIIRLGEWVLLNACREWLLMEAAGMPSLRLAVNLSTRQFRDLNLLDMIKNVLDKTGFNPKQLELEITETMLVDHIDHVIEVLGQLKKLGISITIDDFGTGYSSLSYLKRLPIDMLKVDKSFVMDIPEDKDDMEISAAVIAMAHKLKLQVVAEGVETKAQWDFLKKNNCDIGQGYLFSKSLPPKFFLKWYLSISK
jgi:diguanylate cyclase (GGDEF)-like protein/PAS domain S-box-containing protein